MSFVNHNGRLLQIEDTVTQLAIAKTDLSSAVQTLVELFDSGELSIDHIGLIVQTLEDIGQRRCDQCCAWHQKSDLSEQQLCTECDRDAEALHQQDLKEHSKTLR